MAVIGLPAISWGSSTDLSVACAQQTAFEAAFRRGHSPCVRRIQATESGEVLFRKFAQTGPELWVIRDV
jgi:hypothetical protein